MDMLMKDRRAQRENVIEVYNLVDDALAKLSSLEKLSFISEQDSPLLDKIHYCKLCCRFFNMILMSLFTLDDICIPVNRICEAFSLEIADRISVSRWEISESFRLEEAKLAFGSWILDLQGRIDQCKQEFEKCCERLLHCSFKCTSFEDTMVDFLDAILGNLEALYKYKTDDEIVLLKNQIEIIERKLTFLHNLFDQTPKEWNDFHEILEFKVAASAFAQYSATLVFLYWVNAIDEEMASKLNLLLLDMLRKFNPSAPVFKAFYIRFLMEMRRLGTHLSGQIIHIFVDLFLENLVDVLKDDFQILRDSLMLLLAFLVDPPDQRANDEELKMITSEIEGLMEEDLYLLVIVDGMTDEGKLNEANSRLNDVLGKVQLVKGKVQHAYDQIRDSFSYDFPRTNGLGFFDFLLQNIGFLKEKMKSESTFIPFAKHLIIKIEEELRTLRTFLSELFEHQKDHNELEDIWLKVIKLAYQTEHAINLCSVISHPLWYNMARFMEILDEIKVVINKLKKIEYINTYDGGVLYSSSIALNKVPEDPPASDFNEVMVGLEEEADKIIEQLIDGSMNFNIVAIIGMGGIGKTAMAKEVYNAPVVRNHFDVFSFCIVSHIHNARRILVDILGDIMGKDDMRYDKTEGELAHMLFRCLNRRRYLIIMDDIWAVTAWEEVKISFPDDKNGSRLIFTTRNMNVAVEAKYDCIIHVLRFLSDEESWELFQNNAFGRGYYCPPTFSIIGRMIVEKCKGLPLAIVLIARLIARSSKSLDMWYRINEEMGSGFFMEGYMKGLELSYKLLPEHLKPCFLYIGTYIEDTIISAKKLTLLWIGEGFVLDSNRKSLENVAKEYLHDLVDRSLVIVNEQSSCGEIKSIRIHDILHNFCQRKAEEENFFHLVGRYKASSSSSSTVHYPYRVSFHMNGINLNDATNTLLDRRKEYIIRHEFPYISNLKLVRVMDLEELEDARDETCSHLIKEIASLVHLRYIAASFPYVKEITIPISISNLWKLEILILTARMVNLPETIWNMTRLRHVSVGRCFIRKSGVKKHEAYPQTVNLVSFSSLNITSKEELEDLLQRSPSLRKLSFHDNISELSDETFCFPKLDSLSKLESLKVFNMGTPCLHLFNFLANLTKLSLSSCYLPWRFLPMINKMPCLVVLKLLDNAFIGHEWNAKDTGFPNLRFLKMDGLNLMKWIASDESFPVLEVLILNRCHRLNTVPPSFGETSTLQWIKVYESGKAVASVHKIQENQQDLGNNKFSIIA